jgi:hypothetical protein
MCHSIKNAGDAPRPIRLLMLADASCGVFSWNGSVLYWWRSLIITVDDVRVLYPGQAFERHRQAKEVPFMTSLFVAESDV